MQIDIEKFNKWFNFVFFEASRFVEEDTAKFKIKDRRADHFFASEAKHKMDATTSVIFMSKLFNQADELFQGYSDNQVAFTLRYILEYEYFDGIAKLNNKKVPWPMQQVCFKSILNIYKSIFQVRCSHELSGGEHKSTYRLNILCYLFWDQAYGLAFIRKSLTNFLLGQRKTSPEFDREILLLFKNILTIPHEACQESALHGLAQYHMKCPQAVSSIIHEFLEANTAIPEQLKNYALSAQEGKT